MQMFPPAAGEPSGESASPQSSVTLTQSRAADGPFPHFSDRQWFDMVCENFDILP